jgi:hypothetical protein
MAPPNITNTPAKRAAATAATTSTKRYKAKGTASQPIEVSDTQIALPTRLSLRKALVENQVTQSIQRASSVTFEERLRDAIDEDAIFVPEEGSVAATVAITEAVNTEVDSLFPDSWADDLEGIKWERLPCWCSPPVTAGLRPSWIFRHGYRVVLRKNMTKIWFVCRWCHNRNRIQQGGAGAYDVTLATSAAGKHLGLDIAGHGLTKNGPKKPLIGATKSIMQVVAEGVQVPQEVVTAMGSFDQQRFRMAAVMWLVEGNHPLRELGSPYFREMIELANPAAVEALWVSHNSVSAFVMKLFSAIQPRVVEAIRTARSLIHISFDGWTTKGGKRGFLGVVAHFATVDGDVLDMPIDLPQLTGAHTGEWLAEVVILTLTTYGITADNVGYFVLDNASNNYTTVAALARHFNFTTAHRRLRCGPHTLNLIGQMIIFGSDQAAYDNTAGVATSVEVSGLLILTPTATRTRCSRDCIERIY